MWWRVAVIGLLTTVTKAFSPAAIQWGALPARRFVLAPKPEPVPNDALISNIEAPHKKLGIWDQSGQVSLNEIPYFTAQSDGTISSDLLGARTSATFCVEAGGENGNEIGISRCTGKPNQLWTFMTSDGGQRNQIQLKGTNRCIDVNHGEGDLNGAAVELRKCEDKATEKWEFVHRPLLPTRGRLRNTVLPFTMRHVIIFLTVLTGAGVLTLSTGFWHWHRKARTVAMCQGGAASNFGQERDIPLTTVSELHADNGQRQQADAFRKAFNPGLSHLPRLSYLDRRNRMGISVMSGTDATTEVNRRTQILEALKSVDDMMLFNPEEASRPYDVVSLDLVRHAEVDDATGHVRIEIELPVAAASAGAGDRITGRCRAVLQEMFDWVSSVEVVISKQAASKQPEEFATTAPTSDASGNNTVEPGVPGVAGVAHIVAVASCKGGVGKSTTAVNLAYALSIAGKRVGLIDLDIHGSSLPTMVRPEGQLQIVGESMVPLEAHGVKLMSMGFINPGAMPMRGARLTPMVQQLLGRTIWGELDYLIVDMPPGTGDVQLTLSQDFKVSAAVLVTTPQRLSFVDVVKGVEMFDKVGIPTVAVVENMNGVQFPDLVEGAEAIIERHDLSEAAASDLRNLVNTKQPIFGNSHVQQLKTMWGINASFSLPLLPDVAASSDNGVPLMISAPNSEASRLYGQLATAVEAEIGALATLELPQLMYTESDNTVLVALGGTVQKIAPVELRKLCRSPDNRPDDLPADLHPLEITPTGNYAVLIQWSDGHRSLLPYKSFMDGSSTSVERDTEAAQST